MTANTGLHSKIDQLYSSVLFVYFCKKFWKLPSLEHLQTSICIFQKIVNTVEIYTKAYSRSPRFYSDINELLIIMIVN